MCCMQELAREVDEGAAAASREAPSGSQQEQASGAAIPATPVSRPAGRRDSLTLSTMLKQQKASCFGRRTIFKAPAIQPTTHRRICPSTTVII